jgi:hypothetical protein
MIHVIVLDPEKSLVLDSYLRIEHFSTEFLRKGLVIKLRISPSDSLTESFLKLEKPFLMNIYLTFCHFLI